MAFEFRLSTANNSKVRTRKFPLDPTYAKTAKTGDAVTLNSSRRLIKATATNEAFVGVIASVDYVAIEFTPWEAEVDISDTSLYEVEHNKTSLTTASIGKTYGISSDMKLNIDDTTNANCRVMWYDNTKKTALVKFVNLLYAGGSISYNPPDPVPDPEPEPEPPTGSLRIIADRGYTYSSTSDGVVTEQTYRSRHTVMNDSPISRYVYGNFHSNDITTGLSPITVEAALETLSPANVIPITFNGNPSVTIPVGEIVVSDPVNTSLVRGAQIHVRSYVTVGAGQKFPYNKFSNSSQGEGKMASKNTTGAWNSVLGEYWMFAPIAIIGTPAEGAKSFVAVGDSISVGVGSSKSYDNKGFIQQTLVAGNAGYTALGINGQATSGFNAASRKYRIQVAKYATHAVVEMGTNDINQNKTFAQIRDALIEIHNALKAEGLKVIQTTITPWTTSTDGWVTVGNQTVHANASARSQLNAWIRSKPASVDFVWDVAAAIESGDVWKGGMTSDGIHPNQAGHDAMASVIDLTFAQAYDGGSFTATEFTSTLDGGSFTDGVTSGNDGGGF